jgi:hypothetical protein
VRHVFAHPPLPNLVVLIILYEEYYYEALHCVVFSNFLLLQPFFGPNILLSTLFSHTLNLCSFHTEPQAYNVRRIEKQGALQFQQDSRIVRSPARFT